METVLDRPLRGAAAATLEAEFVGLGLEPPTPPVGRPWTAYDTRDWDGLPVVVVVAPDERTALIRARASIRAAGLVMPRGVLAVRRGA